MRAPRFARLWAAARRSAVASPSRPEVHLPVAEAALLRVEYERAAVILEYGSGGSTVLASEMARKVVFSVESDPKWQYRLQDWFAANPPAAQVHLHHGDIGPTKDWGQPQDDTQFRRWPAYPLSVWAREDFVHPDVVLIDGRFRAACLMAVAMQISRPVVVLFDDYRDREAYHSVAEVLGQPALTGRMARFELEPWAPSPERLQWLIGLFLRPF